MAVIRLEDVVKKYGKKIVLDKINLEFKPGVVYGIFGPNGAGKTTLLDIMTDMTIPTTGKVFVDDKRLGKESKEKTSCLIDMNLFGLKVKELLIWYETFFSDFNKEQALSLLATYKIDLNSKFSQMSTGTKEKALLILAISRQTEIYIFDEPLTGIDPIDREEILDLILSKVDENHTIIISTHLIYELERIIDHAIFVCNGQIVLDDTTDKIREDKKLSVNDYYKEYFKK